jgi:N-acetylmuramoyl-L-alanine amidase
VRPRHRPESRRGTAARIGCGRLTTVCGGALRALPLIVCLLCLGAAAPAKSRIRYVTSGGVRYLYMVDIAAAWGMRYESAGKRFAMRSRYSSLLFNADDTEAVINGTRVRLSDAPWVASGYAVLADVDFRLLLSPILSAASLRRGDVRRVLIDPGHGGKDPGTLGGKHKEKDITLQVARRLEKELLAKGYSVALTRTRDLDLSLAARPQKAKSWKADIMVSIHCNAAGSGIQGIESFRVPPVGARSTYGTQRATVACTNNAWDADNARLAYEVQRALVAATGAVDRGVRNARFLVIKESPCPAVLVEMGFLSNTTDAANLVNASYQTKLAQGIAQGIDRYDACLPPR